jgi:ketosteroid isomerase-like protein
MTARTPLRPAGLILLSLLAACTGGGADDDAAPADTSTATGAAGANASGGPNAPGAAADARVLMEADSAFSAAASGRGLEGFLEFVADSATFFDGSSMQRGREAVGEAWRDLLETPGNSMTWRPTEGDIAASGELGYTIGRWEFTGAEGSARGSYVTIWRRQPDGSWKVVVDIGDVDAPEGGAAAEAADS